MMPLDRAIAALGCVAGLLGVGLSAAAAHVAGPGSLEIAARFLLLHAPVLIGLAAATAAGLAHGRVAHAAGAVLALGLALFSGDLALRGWAGVALLPMAAPAGGIALMLGWALAALSFALGRTAR